MTKGLRQRVYLKYGGRCAYCGCKLNCGPSTHMHVDHFIPVQRGDLGSKERIKKAENIEKLNPACGRCNRYKSTMSLEIFREEISKQVERARKKSWNFRIAEDYGLVEPTGASVVFYFEKI